VHEHEDPLEELRARARKGRITLVFSARDEMHNDAVALWGFIFKRLGGSKGSQSAKKLI
jgi:uncharacterized protein YeaO (DUF488 family)